MVNPAFQLRREGKYKEAEKIAREYLQKDPNNEWNKKALGWILFDKLRNSLKKQRKLTKWNKMDIREFTRLAIPAPDVLYTNFLKVLLRFYRKGDNSALFQIYHLLQNFPIDDFFRPEDYLRRRKGKIQTNSLVESVASALSHHALNMKNVEALEFTLNWLELIEPKFPDNLNIPYYRSRILIELHQYDKALPILQKLVAIKSDWHIWGYMGIVYENIEPEKAIDYLCKSVLSPKDPYLTIRFRTHLARALFKAKRYTEASSEVKYISKLIEVRKLPPKPELEELKKDPNFKEDAKEELPESFYQTYASNITIDYSFLDHAHGIVVDINPQKRKTALVENGIIYLADWDSLPELKDLQKGQKVDIRVIKKKNYFGLVKKVEKIHKFDTNEFPLLVGVWTRDQQKKERGFFYSANYKRIPINANEIEGLNDNINDVVIGVRLFTYRSFEKRKWKNKEIYYEPKVMKEKESEIIINMNAKIKYIDPDKKYYIAETTNQEQVFIPGQVMNQDAMEGYEFEFSVYEGYDKKKKNRSFRALKINKRISP